MDAETPDDMSALPALVELGVGYAVTGTNGPNPYRQLFCCTSNAHGLHMPIAMLSPTVPAGQPTSAVR
jgi:hypothetical protein